MPTVKREKWSQHFGKWFRQVLTDTGIIDQRYPIKGMTVAVAGSTTLSTTRKASADERVEADLRYDANNILVQTEFIHGRDHISDPLTGVHTNRNGNAFYFAVGYTLFDVIQPVARFTFVDPDVKKYTDLARAFELGINYALQKYEARAQIAVSRYTFEKDDAGVEPKAVTQGVATVQVAF